MREKEQQKEQILNDIEGRTSQLKHLTDSIRQKREMQHTYQQTL